MKQGFVEHIYLIEVILMFLYETGIRGTSIAYCCTGDNRTGYST